VPIDDQLAARKEADQLGEEERWDRGRVLHDDELGVERDRDEDGVYHADALVGQAEGCAEGPREEMERGR
jgi:hypothetical protein